MKKIEATRQTKYIYVLLAIFWTFFSIWEIQGGFRILLILTSLAAVISWYYFIRNINKGNILLDNKGLKEDNKTVLTWDKVKGIDKWGKTSIQLLMKDGSIKKIVLFDVSRTSRNDIFRYIKEKVT